MKHKSKSQLRKCWALCTRGHAHWVVTEHGIVDLFGKNPKQRAKALISIADPSHREELEAAYHTRFCKK